MVFPLKFVLWFLGLVSSSFGAMTSFLPPVGWAFCAQDHTNIAATKKKTMFLKIIYLSESLILKYLPGLLHLFVKPGR